MNFTANIRTLVKSLLPDKLARNSLKYLTLTLAKYYQWKLKQKIFLRKDTSDVNVFAEIFLFKDYKYNLPFIPRTIVDAGANVGYASLWFHKKYPDAQIIAIEPEQSNFELLEKNTKEIPNITPLKKGLWSSVTTLEIINESGSKYGFITIEAPNSKDGIETTTVTNLLDIFESKGIHEIDIFKIDIEGAEKELFSKNLDTWINRVKIIIIELHEESHPGCTDIFMHAINKFGFELLTVKGENLVYINRAFN